MLPGKCCNTALHIPVSRYTEQGVFFEIQQFLKKYQAFHPNRRSITLFTTMSHWYPCLCGERRTHFAPSLPTWLRSVLILSSLTYAQVFLHKCTGQLRRFTSCSQFTRHINPPPQKKKITAQNESIQLYRLRGKCVQTSVHSAMNLHGMKLNNIFTLPYKGDPLQFWTSEWFKEQNHTEKVGG